METTEMKDFILAVMNEALKTSAKAALHEGVVSSLQNVFSESEDVSHLVAHHTSQAESHAAQHNKYRYDRNADNVTRQHGYAADAHRRAAASAGTDKYEEHGQSADHASYLAHKITHSFRKNNGMKIEEAVSYKKGDHVIPSVGPHAGKKHEVIHVHPDGDLNIKPIGMHPKAIKYRLGAARATPDQVEHSFNESEEAVFGNTTSVLDSDKDSFKIASLHKLSATHRHHPGRVVAKTSGGDCFVLNPAALGNRLPKVGELLDPSKHRKLEGAKKNLSESYQAKGLHQSWARGVAQGGTNKPGAALKYHKAKQSEINKNETVRYETNAAGEVILQPHFYQYGQEGPQKKPGQVGESAPMIKPSHSGRLHKALGVPEGKPIPADKLAAALKSKDPHMRKMANFAKSAKSWVHEAIGDLDKDPHIHPEVKLFHSLMTSKGYTHSNLSSPGRFQTHNFTKGAHEFQITHRAPQFGAHATKFDYSHSGGTYETGTKDLNLRGLLDAYRHGRVNESTAPGQEDWVKANKKRFVDQYGEEKGKRVLYATAWKMHNKDN